MKRKQSVQNNKYNHENVEYQNFMKLNDKNQNYSRLLSPNMGSESPNVFNFLKLE